MGNVSAFSFMMMKALMRLLEDLRHQRFMMDLESHESVQRHDLNDGNTLRSSSINELPSFLRTPH
jgi:hypothetical protein